MKQLGKMLGVAVAGAVVVYGAYYYLQRRKRQQTKKVIDDIMKEIANANVIVRDPVGLREKLRIFLEGGAEKMQCVSDFDGTLTRATYNGKRAQSSFAVVARSALMPQDVEEKEQELRAKYYPVERSSDKTEEKCKAMEEWWRGIFMVLEEGGFKKEMIPEMVKNGSSVLREGGLYFLQKLHDEKIPILVFSAGVGDVVEEVLKQETLDASDELFDNITIVSNFIKWNKEGGMEGIDGDILHSSNKGDFAASLGFKHTVEDRNNILLLGDNVGDSEMLKTVERVNSSLNIGFLNDNVNELRKDFEQLYDIVILNPESMTLVGVLMMKLLDKKNGD